MKILEDPAGEVCVKERLRAYFSKGLAHFPGLRFLLRGTFSGMNSIVLLYTSLNDEPVCEGMVLNDRGLVTRGLSHYGSRTEFCGKNLLIGGLEWPSQRRMRCARSSHVRRSKRFAGISTG